LELQPAIAKQEAVLNSDQKGQQNIASDESAKKQSSRP
jgi:hypothetical protein